MVTDKTVVEKAKSVVSGNSDDGVKRYMNVENNTDIIINNGGPGWVSPPGGGAPQYLMQTKLRKITLKRGEVFQTSEKEVIDKIEKNQYFGVAIIPWGADGKPLPRDYGDKLNARIRQFRTKPDESAKPKGD